jgi:oxalate decarboxylase/phosphoglucose isomerase-like protein (cupin superfamily)
VAKGTTIYTKPGAVHKMINLTDTPLQAIWIWWAPNGDKEVFDSEYVFTEDAPLQPENTGFRD